MASTAFTRGVRRLAERLGVRVVPLVGLAAAAAGIVALERTRATNFVASGVTRAPETSHTETRIRAAGSPGVDAPPGATSGHRARTHGPRTGSDTALARVAYVAERVHRARRRAA